LRKYQTMGIVFLFLGILATAFTGGVPKYVQIHDDCLDTMDNDLDGRIDVEDDSCYMYPYADGNGESETLLEDQYTKSRYVSLFDYHLENAIPGDEEQMVCVALAIELYGEEDQQKAIKWIAENNVNCEGSGP